MVSGEESDSNTHAQRPKLRHRLTIARNAASLLTSDVFNRVTTFVVYAMVARFLGAFEFGQLSLALSLFFAFHAFAGAGLRTLITRDVARDRTLTSRYLVHASVLVVAAFALSLAVLALFVVAIGYTRDTAVLVLLLALGLLPYALSTTMEGIFQAWGADALHRVREHPCSSREGRHCDSTAHWRSGHGGVDRVADRVTLRGASSVRGIDGAQCDRPEAQG